MTDDTVPADASQADPGNSGIDPPRRASIPRSPTVGPTGHTPRLSDAQLAAVRQALRQGARAHGFDTDHWTLERIATVIEQETGVAYHPGHVWKLLRRRLGWRLQRPARRAIERDEQAIRRWVESDWPRIRQKRPST